MQGGSTLNNIDNFNVFCVCSTLLIQQCKAFKCKYAISGVGAYRDIISYVRWKTNYRLITHSLTDIFTKSYQNQLCTLELYNVQDRSFFETRSKFQQGMVIYNVID